MGHIAPDATKLLVKKQMVEGIELDKTQNPCICDSCEYAKTSHKLSNTNKCPNEPCLLVIRSTLISEAHLQSKLKDEMNIISVLWMTILGSQSSTF